MQLSLFNTILCCINFGATVAAVVDHKQTDCTSSNTTASPSLTASTSSCQTLYPSEIRQINQRYPNKTLDASTFNMILRNPVSETAAQVQFQNVPKTATSCQFELIFPPADFTRIGGVLPVVNVYQVARAAAPNSTWTDYVGNQNGSTVWGSIDLEPASVQKIRDAGSRLSINTAACNDTMTWQLGFANAGNGSAVNYWDFPNVNPPANPIMGWRLVHSC